jgi:hypothetical protein
MCSINHIGFLTDTFKILLKLPNNTKTSSAAQISCKTITLFCNMSFKNIYQKYSYNFIPTLITDMKNC